MVSDVLSDAIHSIREYLDAEPSIYVGPMRTRIELLVKEMDYTRSLLDTPPTRAELDAREQITVAQLVDTHGPEGQIALCLACHARDWSDYPDTYPMRLEHLRDKAVVSCESCGGPLAGAR